METYQHWESIFTDETDDVQQISDSIQRSVWQQSSTHPEQLVTRKVSCCRMIILFRI